MSKSLQDILGWVALTKAVNAVKDGVPNPFPPWLMTVSAENKIVGNSVKANRLYGQRQTARTIRYGAPPRHRAMQQEELNEFKFISFSEERVFDPYVLQTLRNYENFDNMDRAKRIVANNVKTLGTLFGNARVVSLATTLAYGAVYDDSNGNILPTSSGAANTYTHNIPSANIGTVTDDTNASAGIFGATGQGSWAANSTNIPLQLTTLQEMAAADHGYEPEIALYGKSVRGYMVQNDYVLDFLARNPTMQNEWLKDKTIPDGLFGFTWAPVNKASYTKDDSTKVKLWPTNGVTFMPGESERSQFWTPFEGSNLIPTTIDIIPDAMAAMNSLETVYGAAGYAQISHKPVSLSVVMVDTFWWGIRIPEALYIADVVA